MQASKETRYKDAVFLLREPLRERDSEVDLELLGSIWVAIFLPILAGFFVSEALRKDFPS